jgi:hypothetical protein
MRRGYVDVGDFKILGFPDDLRDAVVSAAQAEGKSVDEIAIAALKRGMAQRTLDRFARRAEVRRAGMTEEQIDDIVDQAVQQSRGR